ncbi:TetR/AcrR family transcriptional regulator [Luteibacter sp. CQ10]|uniref:TetR/AcrR family transcriptional regulator n=1 Tax=Luteibacter sp. CQ10 TaxID=2805821 RepID=UPI0034A3C46D
MRVSKQKSEENRTLLLNAAGRLFREKGIDGVGVAEVAKQAGLTHGALYAHFPSKEALVAAAFSQAFAGNMAAIDAWAAGKQPTFADYLEALFSVRARDRVGEGCPMVASASEASRHGPALSENFAAAFQAEVALLEASLDPALPAGERRRVSIAALAAQIGAVAVARAVAASDDALSQEVLDATRDAIARGV